MDLGLILLAGMYVFAGFVGCSFLFQRWRWRRRKSAGWERLGFYPSATSLGNALHQLQTIAEPHAQHAVAERLAEEAEEDDAAGPDDPAAHLLRQARRIRRGEVVDRLTALRQ